MADFSLSVSATNYPRIRAALLKMSGGTWYRGIIRDAAIEVLTDWTRYAKSITHKLTGMLAESHMWEYDSHASRGRVFINPRSVGKRGQSTVVWPKLYGPYEHARGGSHAFYSLTLNARGHKAESAAFKALVRGIPRV